MLGNTILIGEQIILRNIFEINVTDSYLKWLRDPNVNCYLESRWEKHSIRSVKKYISDLNKSKNNEIFGIFSKSNNVHIGNLKIGQISHINLTAEIGLIIGNKNYWNKNIATEAIFLATNYSFNELKLNKLYAFVYENNIGSLKVFLKNGYNVVGAYKKHVRFENSFIDLIFVEKLSKNII